MNPPSRGQTGAIRTQVLIAPVSFFFQAKGSSRRGGSYITAANGGGENEPPLLEEEQMHCEPWFSMHLFLFGSKGAKV